MHIFGHILTTSDLKKVFVLFFPDRAGQDKTGWAKYKSKVGEVFLTTENTKI